MGKAKAEAKAKGVCDSGCEYSKKVTGCSVRLAFRELAMRND